MEDHAWYSVSSHMEVRKQVHSKGLDKRFKSSSLCRKICQKREKFKQICKLKVLS